MQRNAVGPATLPATDACDASVTAATLNPDVITPGACANAYTITRTWTATDACGNSRTATQIITVVDTTAPVVTIGSIATCYLDVASAEAAAIAATSASDNCGGLVTKTASTLGTCPATITVIATDACGNPSVPVTYSTRIDNTLPVIGAVTAAQGTTDVKACANNAVQGLVTFKVEASDNCFLANGHPDITLTDGATTQAATFISGTGTPGDPFVYGWTILATTANATWTATVTASDSCNSVTTTFTVCVNKTQITGQVQLQNFVGTGTVPLHTRTVTFVATDGVNVLKTWVLPLSNVSGDTFDYTLTDVPAATTHLSAKTAWTLRKRLPASLDINGQAVVNFTGANLLKGGDFSGDNAVTFLDYSTLVANWLTANPVADITGDGTVNVFDYSTMASNWFNAGDPQ